MSFLFKPAPHPSVTIRGSSKRFPVRRIFCVGRNYRDHVIEMGSDPSREPPCFFTKPADAILENGEILPYPPATENLHHEVELVVALNGFARGASVADAEKIIFGYAVGNDFTRRDLQHEAKDAGRPWDTAKGFDHSAAIGAIVPADEITLTAETGIGLKVNGVFRQKATLGEMIWSVAETISTLSGFFDLYPGDLIYMGTPAGVGPVVPGDLVEGSIQGLGTLSTKIAAAQG